MNVTTDLSLLTLVSQASLLVKLVMLLLLAVSLVSWWFIFRKSFILRDTRRRSEDFERTFWSGPDLNQLFQSIVSGRRPAASMDRIFEAGFREFVRRHPDAALADQAQYWVGESLFSQARASLAAGQSDKATRELEQAVQEFRRVSLNYPRGDKVPTALYKEALALLELKQPRLAQTRLQYLLDNFPQSEEAPLAKERLANLGG